MKKMITKISFATVIIFGFFSSVASAHVKVNPKTSATGEEETYTVKVPVEKEVASTKFTLKMPSGVEFDSFQPVAGWNFSSQKDSDGKVSAITFESTDKGILPGQFQQFVFVAKNPNSAQKVTWDAYQYYKDGSVVEWTGDEGSESPHSITDIVVARAGDQQQGQAVPQTKDKTKTDVKPNSGKTNSFPLILSIVALALSASASVASRKKK
jgi:uncharacterized protein YcnI